MVREAESTTQRELDVYRERSLIKITNPSLLRTGDVIINNCSSKISVVERYDGKTICLIQRTTFGEKGIAFIEADLESYEIDRREGLIFKTEEYARQARFTKHTMANSRRSQEEIKNFQELERKLTDAEALVQA